MRGAVVALGGLFVQVDQGDKGVSRSKTAKVAIKRLVSWVTASGEVKPTNLYNL